MFERLSIPTPFQIGRVNAYVAGHTIVDPGPASEEAWSALLTALAEADLDPDDVEQVLVTHPHPDHFGLARRFRDRGARVLASEPAAGIIANFGDRLQYEQRYFQEFFQRHGMAQSTAKTVTELPEAFVQYAPDVDTDRVLDAADTVTVDGRTLDVGTTTGHAPGELTFAYDHDDERHAVVGDNVLPEITPNPLLQPPMEEGDDRPRVLPAFNDALAALRARDYDRLLPGHREVIDDPAARIDEILAAHEDRTENVRDLLDDPTTAVDVMNGLFEDLPATEQFSGMSEAVGHLDVLEARGEVERDERGGMVVYERT
ncbi:MBL fold metallo-hydrolase [Halorubellus sp. JP-L1]|uniref:MBL fold metallo-hydrolase n=1 Tax=Halorubellus sp. JP-L1 TaxID=2715753 RepID=UPI001409D2C2|nr:MBL fold metallo-hydrolase [Halorubellus sp. JP-L1]